MKSIKGAGKRRAIFGTQTFSCPQNPLPPRYIIRQPEAIPWPQDFHALQPSVATGPSLPVVRD